jgi:hypothetical protein
MSDDEDDDDTLMSINCVGLLYEGVIQGLCSFSRFPDFVLAIAFLRCMLDGIPGAKLAGRYQKRLIP